MTHLGNVPKTHTGLLRGAVLSTQLSVALYFIEGYALGSRAPL